MKFNKKLGSPAGEPMEEVSGDVGTQLLEGILQEAETAGVSDVHFQKDSNGEWVVSFRVDGVLSERLRVKGVGGERLVGRIKYLANLKTYQESLPQDGRLNAGDLGLASDARVATYPTVLGEKVVVRLFHHHALPDLMDLGMEPGCVEAFQRFLKRPSGLMLLTGPAGSGKTTTIYACLQYLVGLGGRHIVTIEDPVERIVPGVMQTETSEERGLGYARALRHLLRQDPQVLALGEIRDEETAELVARAALTGHLVLSTLHAGSCRKVAERLENLCSDSFTWSNALEFVVNQRLVRRTCGKCEGKGCERCWNTGFSGRLPMVEWYRVKEEDRSRFRVGDFSGIQPESTLSGVGRRWVEEGVTSEREVERVLGSEG